VEKLAILIAGGTVRTIIHEMRNHLAVAVANIEAFVDGKLEPTPARMRGVLQELGQLDSLIDEIGTSPVPPQSNPKAN
jgi:hypothetical protein